MSVVKRLLAFALTMISLPGLGHGEAGPLDDPRLGQSAGELRALVAGAAHDGLPSELLVDKLREGLAKGVPPPRLVAAERALATALAHAHAEAVPFGEAARDRALIKAIVDAHRAGVSAAEVTAVLTAVLPPGQRTRALEVLTDLAVRGYPADAAARTVAAVGKRGPVALGQLVAEAERLRTGQGATAAEALDALQRTAGRGLGLERSVEALRHGDVGDDNGRGPDRETSGGHGPKTGGEGKGKGH
jgi:hypothetical protein